MHIAEQIERRLDGITDNIKELEYDRDDIEATMDAFVDAWKAYVLPDSGGIHAVQSIGWLWDDDHNDKSIFISWEASDEVGQIYCRTYHFPHLDEDHKLVKAYDRAMRGI